MKSLISRGVVLTASRISNFAVILLSPLLLVRILEIEQYGQYQEFMVYAMILITICAFSIDWALTYFLPRHPEQEREYVSQASVLVLIFSSACLGILLLAGDQLLRLISFDFLLPLAAYVFCFVNLNWLEYYWIAKGRTDLVFFYSAARLIARFAVLVAVAIATRDVITILWSLVFVELGRLVLVAGYMVHSGMFSTKVRMERVAQHVKLAAPVGAAGLVNIVGRNVAKLFVASALGPIALAYYSIAAYVLPLVTLASTSIADVVFPEMVRNNQDPESAIQLWQRACIMYCVILLPGFVLLNYYADIFITVLFTPEYLPALATLHVYSLYLLRRCVNTDILLRTRGRTNFVLAASIFQIIVNVPLMVVLYRLFGMIGPALAFIISEICVELFYIRLIRRDFGLSIFQLVEWSLVGRIALGCVAGMPLLLLAGLLPAPEIVRAILGSAAFVSAAWWTAYRLGVIDIGRLIAFFLSTTRKLGRPG